MRLRFVEAALLAALLAVPAGCGGSASPASSSTALKATTSPASSAKTKAKRRAHRRPTAVTTTTTAPRSATTVATAPPPAPPSTPPAPDGLRATTGYATYELCSSSCGGSVPASLRRPLHLPRLAPGAACPASAAGGPVTPRGPARLSLSPFVSSAWQGARVTWVASPRYRGPVLIRGRQLGGARAVGFGEGHVPYDELQLLASGTGTPPQPPGGRAWLSFTRVRGPGCYAYQVDGTGFSTVAIFQATG